VKISLEILFIENLLEKNCDKKDVSISACMSEKVFIGHHILRKYFVKRIYLFLEKSRDLIPGKESIRLV